MERVAIADADARNLGDDSRVASLSDALRAEHVALNHYRLGPGDGFPSGLHAHTDQEEVFVVLDGTATFETCPSPVGGDSGATREFTVGAGECVRFAPMEFQSGRNAGNEALVALAIGAPPNSEDVRVPFACPNCGEAALALDFEDEFSFRCPDCGAERVPTDCPDCGNDDLRATLGSDGDSVVAACPECGTEHDHPPVRDEW